MMMKKTFIIALLFPFWLSAQTVHLKDKKIEYKDDVKLQGVSEAEIFDRAQAAMKSTLSFISNLSVDKDKKELQADGVIRLASEYPVIRNVHYTLKLSVHKDGYHYKIDDVSLWEQRRGDKGHLVSSSKIVDQLDESGKPAIEAEHVLNAIDLNLQKTLSLVENKIKG